MNTPNIRFKGYTDDWEQRPLGELIKKYEDPIETPHGGYERLGIRSHAKGTFHTYVEAGKELEAAKMHRVAANKFILNITFAWEHAVAITDENDEGKLVSHRFPQFSFSSRLNSHFFKYFILDKRFREHLVLSSPGGAGRNRVLKISDMMKYIVLHPDIEEQEKIGKYLDNLDSLITLHQRKHDEIKSIKKYMLQKMFPKEGEKVPEIRFPGFTADWEQRKLSEETKSIDTGKSKFVAKEAGKYEILGSTSVIGYDDSFDYEGSFLLTARVGANAGELYRHTGRVKISDNTVFIQGEYLDFIFYMLMNFNIKKLSFGTGQPLVKASELKGLELHFPSNDEKEQIGNYFVQLDTLITLYQQECEKYKELKKGLLQQMFI